jgi:hypothetical protein
MAQEIIASVITQYRQKVLAVAFSGLVLIALFCFSASGQQAFEPLRAVPPPLRDRLAERLRLFAESQRNQDWTDVSRLLGDYYLPQKRIAYTSEQKVWLIDQLKQTRMLSFTIEDTSWSTAVLSLPFSKRYWFIDGLAEFSDGAVVVKKRAMLLAYRQNDDWYFYPFIRNECGDIQYPQIPDSTPQERAEGELPELSLSLSPSSPIEVFDISVEKAGDSSCSKERRLTFKIKNVSRKVIRAYGFQIGDIRREGSIDVGVSLPEKLGVGKTYTYEGVTFTANRPHILTFDSVAFVDGSFWRPAKRSTRRPGKKR